MTTLFTPEIVFPDAERYHRLIVNHIDQTGCDYHTVGSTFVRGASLRSIEELLGPHIELPPRRYQRVDLVRSLGFRVLVSSGLVTFVAMKKFSDVTVR